MSQEETREALETVRGGSATPIRRLPDGRRHLRSIPDFEVPRAFGPKTPTPRRWRRSSTTLMIPKSARRPGNGDFEPRPTRSVRTRVIRRWSTSSAAGTLVTQNVDGLHREAGTDPGHVVEIHGTLQEVQCLDCGERAPTIRALLASRGKRIPIAGPAAACSSRRPSVWPGSRRAHLARRSAAEGDLLAMARPRGLSDRFHGPSPRSRREDRDRQRRGDGDGRGCGPAGSISESCRRCSRGT